MKKLCAFLAIVIIFSTFVSCSDKTITSNESGSQITSSEVSSENNKEKTFSLPYFAKDTLNPYTASQSINFYLASLLYDPLFTLDNNFDAKQIIADKISVDADEVRVSIKSGLKFSDGSTITIKDVQASLSTAISSKYYSARLSNISSYSVNGDELIIKLKEKNMDFAKNLNFPIIKNGLKENGAIGSGRYCFSGEDSQRLIKNPNSVQNSSDIEVISLVEIHKYSDLPHMIKIGSVNFAYADSVDITNAATKTSTVYTNNIVYLGINSANGLLSNQDFRKAISLCINRKNILTDAFAGSGNATAQPFNPICDKLNSENYKINLTDINAAKELFSIVGLTQKDENGIFKGVDDKPITLKLVVNGDNSSKVRAAEYIKLNLQSQGIGVEIIAESAQAYQTRVANKDYDLFLGEVKLTPDNDISRLLVSGSLNAYDDSNEMLATYKSYLAEDTLLDDFLRAFDIKTPFIPILYKNSMAVFSGTLNGNEKVTEYDVFAAMANWKY